MKSRRRRKGSLLAGAVMIGMRSLAGPVAMATASPGSGPDDVGLPSGASTHVRLIILENKPYDATFTGLNHNTHLWQTIPSPAETCNTIDDVALLTLCPSEQAQIPPSAQDTVHQLGQAIGAPAG